MSLPDDESLDPFEAHFHREPLPGASVRILVIGGDALASASPVATTIAALLKERGRDAEVVSVSPREDGLGAAVARGLEGGTFPLLLMTREGAIWNGSHIDALLDAIDHCDHVFGKRTKGRLGGVVRWVVGLPWRWVFAVPVVDVHSPYRLHRRERLNAIPLQSRSDFLNLEVVVKATFLGHLIDEVDVNESKDHSPTMDWRDVALVFKHPTFVRPFATSESESEVSSPSEETEGQHESDHGPGSEDQHGRRDVEHSSAFEDDRAEGVQKLSEGQRLDDRLDGVGEAFR